MVLQVFSFLESFFQFEQSIGKRQNSLDSAMELYPKPEPLDMQGKNVPAFTSLAFFETLEVTQVNGYHPVFCLVI